MVGRVTQKGNTIYLSLSNNWYQYDVRDQLGSGAMGIVYKGVNCQTGEEVAIKRIKDQYANNYEIRNRAHIEADLMFRHPNLVEMIGCCEISPNKGPIFLISKLVKGENIDVFINKNVRSMPNAEHRICELFFSVLDALSYIHQKGIIHMDIKPSNIMIEQGRNVRLMDLGIANISDTANTSTSGMMGTPKYAAPEQFSDITNHPELTSATDIYEAGITLYELITRQNPFTPNNINEAKRMHQEIILEKTNKISDAVYNVIRKATAIKASDRYQSANQMKMELKQALTMPTKSSKKWLWISLALAVCVLSLLLILFLIFI